MEKINADELKDLLNDATRKMESANDNITINTIIENLIVSAVDSEFASLWAFNDKEALLLRERSEESVRKISMLDQRGVLGVLGKQRHCLISVHTFRTSQAVPRPSGSG